MLEQDYLSWSRQMEGLLQGDRAEWAKPWLALCQQCDPLAPANENQLAAIAQAYTDYLVRCKMKACILFNRGVLCCLAIWPVPPHYSYSLGWMSMALGSRVWLRPINTQIWACCAPVLTITVIRSLKAFIKSILFVLIRQIVLVDCLQPLNRGPQAFNDMRLALTQLMQSFHYGKRTLFRRLFSPCIDKLMFAATKADHVTADQHANLVSLLQQLVQEAWQNAAFEGISMDCVGLASVQATESGMVDHQGQKIPALRGHRLEDGAPLTVFPGDVPARLPGPAFWQQQGFHFDQFRPQAVHIDSPLPHIRLDAVMEFLLGDKLR